MGSVTRLRAGNYEKVALTPRARRKVLERTLLLFMGCALLTAGAIIEIIHMVSKAGGTSRSMIFGGYLGAAGLTLATVFGGFLWNELRDFRGGQVLRYCGPGTVTCTRGWELSVAASPQLYLDFDGESLRTQRASFTDASSRVLGKSRPRHELEMTVEFTPYAGDVLSLQCRELGLNVQA